MRSGGGGGENFEGDRDVDFYRLPSQYQIILLMTEMVAVMVKMMRMVSLMVAMVASMGRPFAFSLANLPVFPQTRAVVHHGGTTAIRCIALPFTGWVGSCTIAGGSLNCILMISNLLLPSTQSMLIVPSCTSILCPALPSTN